MEPWANAFFTLLKNICSELWTRQGQNLASLVSMGHVGGALSWKIFHEYKDWGILHLLVLSGSQYEAFSRGWMHLCQGLQRYFFKVSFPRITRFSLLPASFIYLSALKAPAPLLRCALLFWAFCLLRPYRIQKHLVIVLVFAVQIFIIEKASPSDSAFLSWLSYLLLLTVNHFIRKAWLRALSLSLLLSFTVSVLKNQPLSVFSLCVAGLSNLICLPLFEKLLFPVVGYLSALCLLLCPLLLFGLNPYIFKVFLAIPLSLFLDLALCPVLVANSAFRYTFHE